MKNLNSLNVQEMSVREMKKTDGGIWVIGALLIGLVIGAIGLAGYYLGQELCDRT